MVIVRQARTKYFCNNINSLLITIIPVKSKLEFKFIKSLSCKFLFLSQMQLCLSTCSWFHSVYLVFTDTPKKVHRVTNYRRKLKLEQPEKYEEYLKKQKERCKKGRDNLKKQLSKKKPSREALQKKQHQLQQQRKRQAKYMEKRFLNISEENYVKSKKGTVATRNKMQSKREYNRNKQRICRSKMTSQKKNSIKKKDRKKTCKEAVCKK